MLTIYTKDNSVRATLEPSEDAYVLRQISNECYLNVKFITSSDIGLQEGDYILFDGFTYSMLGLGDAQVEKKASNHFEYTCKFQSPREDMDNVNLQLFDNTTSSITPEYNSETTYSQGDVVTYHTLYWEMIYATSIMGIAPEESDYWQLKSNVTHAVAAYSATTTYTLGDEVTYNDCIWKHIGSVDTVGKHPEEGDYWTQLSTAPEWDFSTVLTPKRYAQLFCDNMNRARPNQTWSVGYTISDSPKEQAFSNVSVLSALGTIATLYDTEFWIGETTHNVYTINIGKLSNDISLTMKYGKGNGFTSIQRNSISSSKKITRLIAQGGEKNLLPTYRGGAKRLMLPDKYYLDASNIDLKNPKEGMYTWDDIYPAMLHATEDYDSTAAYVSGDMVLYNSLSWTCLVSCTGQTPAEGTYWQITEGTVTTAVGEYKLIDKNLTFNPRDASLVMTDGTQPKVHFITGNLAGYEFPITDFNTTTKQITISSIQDGNDSTLPTAGYTFGYGDQFNIVDFYMPDEYITKNENYLKAKAQEYLDQYSLDQVSYKGTVDEVWSTTNQKLLHMGDLITMVDSDYGINSKYRITSLKKYVRHPYKYEIDLDNTPFVASKIQSIVNKVNETSTYVQYSNLDTQMAKVRTFKSASEAISMAFDPESDYFSDGIAPLFVKTAMALFGTETQQYSMTGINVTTTKTTPNVVTWVAGTITDSTQQDTDRTWNVASGSFTATDNDIAYYCYFKCTSASGSTTAELIFSETQYKVNADSSYYYFLLGTLSKYNSTLGIRQFYTSIGYTFINGGNIITGKIMSADGLIYMDLDNGKIHFGGESDNYFEFDSSTGKFTIKNMLLAQKAYIQNLIVSQLSTSQNPYHLLLSVLDSSLGIFRNSADSVSIGNAIIGMGKDISIQQATGQRKPALTVSDKQWQGNYSSTTIYYKDDRVYYATNGNTYIFSYDWLSTDTPTAGLLPTNTTYWTYLGSGNLGGGKYSEVGCEGMFANGSNIQGFDGSTGISNNFSQVALLQKRNSSTSGVSSAILGLDQTSDSDTVNASPSYGGWFNRLFVVSELENITTSSDATAITLNKTNYLTYHYYGSTDKTITLPVVNYRDKGLKFIFRKVNAGNIIVTADSGHYIIDGSNAQQSSITVDHGYTVIIKWDGNYWVACWI